MAVLTESARADLNWGLGGAGGSGTWDATSTTWWNGTANAAWDGGVGVFGGSAGTVTLAASGPVASGLTFNTAGYELSGGTLQGMPTFTVTTNGDATISSTLAMKSGYGTLIKTGSAVLTVQGGNSFDRLQINQGEYRLSGSSTLQDTDVTLANVPGATLTLGPTTGIASLQSLSGGGVVQPAAGASTELRLRHYGTFGGVLRDNGAAILALTMTGGPYYDMYEFTSAHTYSGATSFSLATMVLRDGGALLQSGAVNVQVGELTLDNDAQAQSNRLKPGATLALRSGTLRIAGNAQATVTESLGTISVDGGSALEVDAYSGVATTLNVGAISRPLAGTLKIDGAGNVHLASSTLTNGILPAYVVRDRNWASVDANGFIVPFRGYTDPYFGGSSDHVLATQSNGYLTADRQFATLNLQDVGIFNLFGHKLTLTRGGLLSSSAFGSGNTNFLTNGTLTASTNELLVQALTGITIGATITEGALPTSLVIGGGSSVSLTAANTFSGDVYVNGSTLRVPSEASLGRGSRVILDNSSFSASGSFTLTRPIEGRGWVGIDTGAYHLTLAGAFPSQFSKGGSGTLELGLPNLGEITVTQGQLLAHGVLSGDVTLHSGALLADGHLHSITIARGAASIISPGGDSVGTLSAATVIWGGPDLRFTLQLDVNATAADFLAFSPAAPFGVVLDLRNAGGAQIGTEYPFASFAGSSFGMAPSDFSLSAQSVQNGWAGSFRTQDGTAYVTFTSVPEPATAASLLLGALACGSRRRRREGA